ncbi:MAG TPA: DNA polymerase III subunit delta' [Burkholderiales bacterium]|nr:DNA polymerase III subunit delta' [Burkholderiales bacterium]
MSEQIFPWQIAAFNGLAARGEQLPHALLIQGRAGIGKTVFARAFAAWLLCEGARSETAACGECEPCRWFEQGNHPDFRQIEPEFLSPEMEGVERSKEPSRQIKIEQVRELQRFLAVGTHRAGRRVAIVRPAEAMNVATANALLKSLEEPPPDTLFLLVASQPARLLPTVRSRCQAVHLPAPDAETAAQWLAAQGFDEARAMLAHCANAPLAAIEAADQRPLRDRLLTQLARGESDPLVLADACAGAEPVQVIDWLQKWIYDLSAVQFAGEPRYHPQARAALQKLVASLAPRRLLAYQRELAHRRAVAQHPLNPRLFLEELFMRYRALRD